MPRCLEMVDRPRAELDRQRDRPLLGELIAVHPKCETGGPAGFEVTASLVDVERSLLEEDVCGDREVRRLGQDFGKRKVEIGIGVGELRWHRMGAEPGRDPADLTNRPQRRELRLAVEPVA